jgi:hypothetical protein
MHGQKIFIINDIHYDFIKIKLTEIEYLLRRCKKNNKIIIYIKINRKSEIYNK